MNILTFLCRVHHITESGFEKKSELDVWHLKQLKKTTPKGDKFKDSVQIV